MPFYPAKVADILRCNQRDQAFITDLEDQINSFFQLIGGRNYHTHRKTIPRIATVWYHLVTSLNNLQTLGEEYTGIIRLNSNNQIPSKIVQTLWLILYIGGEPLTLRLLEKLRKLIDSSELTPSSKSFFTRSIDFVKQTDSILRLHHSLFYITGKFYNLSNRLTGIRYVLLRDWLQDDTFTENFKLLGNLSLFYILFNSIQQLWSSEQVSSNVVAQNVSTKICVLCSDNLKAPSATLCGHIYCWECIYDSLNYQNTCPICREEVKPSRIVPLQNYI